MNEVASELNEAIRARLAIVYKHRAAVADQEA
jgi:hypothetical protein